MYTIIRIFIAFLIALLLPKIGQSQTLSISETGNPKLDGTYTYTPRWDGFAKTGAVTRAFTKTANNVTYSVYLVENENYAQWVLADNLGNEYFAINCEEKIPNQTPDGWDIGRAGVGLNAKFRMIYEMSDTPDASPMDNASAIPAPISSGEERAIPTTETMLAQVRLYPNPSASKVSIDTDVAIRQVRVFDAAGTMVVSTKGYSFDVRQFSAGIYQVQIETVEGNIVRQLVKQ